MQDEEPFTAFQVPAMHSLHPVTPSGTDEPALQMHLIALSLASGALEFDGHP